MNDFNNENWMKYNTKNAVQLGKDVQVSKS